jgi:GTP-binding protein
MEANPPAAAAPVDLPDAEALAIGQALFAGECRFFTEAPTAADLPEAGPPEVAFAGRSNVGKSSLINALTGRRDLARASNTPGRTQSLIFFSLRERLWLVDMPGHGHAEAPKTEIARWTRTVDDYLRGRVTLRRLCLLIDARHGLKPTDVALMDRMDKAAVVYQAILTKADKPRAHEVAAVAERVRRQLAKRPAAHPLVLTTSAETGAGIAELRAELATLATG